MTPAWTGGKLKDMQFSLFGRHFFCSWLPPVQPRSKELGVLQAGLDKLHDLVVITELVPLATPIHRIIYVNEAFENHTGYSRREVIGRSPGLLQGQGTQQTELSRIRLALRESKPVHAELINYKKDGTLFWLELDITPIKDTQDVATHWVSVARDVTLRKSSEEEIEYLAFYDPLTQLPNRQMLMERLERALTQSKTRSRGEPADIYGALMFIDLDNFKALNDTLGHATGDLLLRKVASRLGACVRLSDTVARLGGDEFVVMLEGLPDDILEASDYSRDVAQRILLALSEPYDLAGLQHESTCSIGVTIFSKRRQNLSDLLKQADLAMYHAKASGRNAVCFFYPAMQAVATANAALNLELRKSLRQGDFVLYYQPQVGREGRMFGVEALLRWEHPTRGLVCPDEFIGQAEESGLILQLGQWALQSACAQLAHWALREQTRHLSIAVNVSVRQFRHPEFVELVMMTIKNAGVDANLLRLELTESLLANGMDITIAKMGVLKDAGVTLSIDDFGIGYSALSHLKRLPLNQLKIDRAFVKDILTDPNDAAIARTIIGLAQSLGLGVVAEGVETVAQRDMLRRFGCDCYQDHLFCRALPIAELEVFMAQLAPSPLAA
ncbi:MAG: putative bifunctional diguanylate cyclase/phosphodiesterase [Polaromonas sp.]|jgi:diguanylate cyclase (GGDEF)-like protein/PAS domain S-box-containing protein